MTFSQIEEMRMSPDGKCSLSLQQAARNVGLPFEQCLECKGNGYTKAILLVSMTEIWALAKINPNSTPPIQYDRCVRCNGDGGQIIDADRPSVR